MCDPVLGDDGRLYVPPELVGVYRDKVVPQADLLTPNQFELEQLAGCSVTTVAEAAAACKKLHDLGVNTIVWPAVQLCAAALVYLAEQFCQNHGHHAGISTWVWLRGQVPCTRLSACIGQCHVVPCCCSRHFQRLLFQHTIGS